MDDMQMVRDLAPDVPLPDPAELSPARGRLAVAMRGEPAADLRPARPVRQPRRARRFALAAWVTAGLAVAISAAMVLAPDKTGGQIESANADPALVLHNAAESARKLPDVEPRPHQFIYQKDNHGAESWMSVDGTRDGLRQTADEVFKFPGCRNGQRVAMKGDKVVGTEPCAPRPAYLADLPTDADAMLAYLNKHRSRKPGDANALAKDILSLMNEHYLRPQAQAALFEAAANMPGLRVVNNTTDAAGRPGIAVTWSYEGKSGGLIFDSNTYAFLGVWAGKGSSAVLQVAIVNEVGQRP